MIRTAAEEPTARILVVEDSPTQAERVRLILESEGFDVEIACDGQEGRKKLENSTFDLVVSDVVMPRLSGYDLCRWIRSDPKTQELPVVLLTALNDPMDIVQALEAGADNFISKPFEPEYLLARVRSILDSRRFRSEGKLSVNVEMLFMGRRFIVGSGKEQILGLLLSAFEDMVRSNRELRATQAELAAARERLEGQTLALQVRARQSEEVFATAFRASPNLMAITRLDGTILEVNDGYFRMLGYSREESVGKTTTELSLWADAADRASFIAALEASGQIDGFETRLRRKDGTLVTVIDSARTMQFQGGTCALSVVVDITDRKRAEEQLRKASAYSRSLIEASLDPLVTISPDGKITDVNAATEAVTGRRRADLIGSDFSDYLTEAERAREGYHKVLTDFEVRDYPLTIRHISGRTTDVLYNATVYRDEAGGLQGVFAAARDVSERRRTERIQAATYRISEAAQSAETLNDFFRRAHEIVRTLIPANSFYVALRDPETGMLSFPYFVDEFDPPPGPKPPGRGLTEYVIRTGEPLLATPEVFDDLVVCGEVDLIGAPSVDWLGAPLKAAGGTFGAVVVQTYTAGVRFGDSDRDLLSFISGQLAMAIQRKRSEEALRQSEADLKEAQRVAHLGSWSWIIETDCVTWSEELFRIAGRDPASRPPSYLTEHATLYTSESLARLQPLVERAIRTGEPYEADLELMRPDGTTRWIAATGEARRDTNGRILGLRGTAEDVTERRRLQGQFLQAQKMEAVGRLAGGVAHDFNNILTVVDGYGDMLLNILPEGEPAREYAQEIALAGKRATALTRQLLTFSRKQLVEPKVLDLNDVARDIRGLLSRLLGEDIEIILRLQKGLGLVKADQGQIEQVIMNLSINARDAMPQGGKLILETQDVELDETYAKSHPSVAVGSYVMLAISDTGCGMGPETMSHLFEPFFTTKGVGKGTGLGLATVFGIVKQSGGDILAYSAPGQGTTFKVYLPRVSEATGRRDLNFSHTLIPARGRETVLVVEDDETVGRLTKSMLVSLGYEVLTASRPEAALELASRYPGPIHLLLSDVVMPEMRGPELARRLLAIRPKVRVVFVSGYSEEGAVGLGAIQAGAAFLQKPFTPAALSRKLREALDAGTATEVSA